MTPIDKQALDRAREIIRRDLGDIKDLDEEIRNTIANTYYLLCHLRIQCEGKYAFPGVIALEGDLMKGIERFAEERSFLEAGAEFMPEMIATMRDFASTGDERNYRRSVQAFLDTFKYRIPGIHQQSPLRLAVERPFYAAKAKEIPNLWRLL